MKTLALFLLSATAVLAGDIRAFMWQESRDEKTGEPQYAFYVAPKAVKEMVEASARGDDADAEKRGAQLEPSAWLYVMSLSGKGRIYPKEKIIVGSGHDIIDVASGTVALDVAKRVVKIALQIVRDGKKAEFPGNGTYVVSLPAKK